jgi:putative hydrolase of the HAD superfamily
MMVNNIEAIFLDLGHTLRVLVKDQDHMARARQEITRLIDIKEDPLAFCLKLYERYKVYREWALENMIEAPEAELWTRWLIPEFPAERIAPLSQELTYQYRQSLGRRVVVDGGREVIHELYRRGYILGIISNLIGTREIPEWLAAEKYEPYFKAVILSSVEGIRKPNPAIFYEAARRVGVEPVRCAYVGDNLKRDVTGSRAAGFSITVILQSPVELAEAEITDKNRPDLIIHDFHQLLDVFPEK